MLKRILAFTFSFMSFVVFSQQLEEEIYTATESFIENQNHISLQELNKKAITFKNQIATKDEQLAFVFLLCNKGYYLKEINNATSAISVYEDAWKRYSDNKLSGYDIIEYCLKPLGELYTVSKDYTNAEITIERYLFLAEKEDNKIQINAAIINLSILYQGLGRHRDVIKIVADALKSSTATIGQRQKLTNIKMDSQFALSQILVADEIPKTNTYNYFLKRSQLDLQNGAFLQAEANFERAKELFFKQEDISARMLSKLYVKESELFLKVKKMDKALNSLSMASQALLPNLKEGVLPKEEDLYEENTFIDIFDLIGDLELNIENALHNYDLSFIVADLLRENISSQEDKIINQIDDRIRSEKCIELLYSHYLKTKNKDFLLRAFQYAENSKATVLKEMLQKKSIFDLHPNDRLLQEEQFLYQQLESVTNELIKERYGASRAPVLNVFSEQLSGIHFQLKDVQIEISKKYSDDIRNEISLEKLRVRLKKDKATIIEYFYGQKAIYQIVLSQQNINFYKIVLDESMRRNVSDFIHFFDDASVINNDVKNYTKRAFEIYKSLNLKGVSNTENIIVIPDGLLNFVPFEALLTESTSTTSFSKMPFYLKKQKVVYNSSVEFYLKDITQRKNNRLLGVFPVFEKTNRQLTYSVDEANAIRDEVSSTILMKDKATKNNFIENISNYGILHLSTHAKGGGFLEPASIDFYDDTLLLNELYSLDLDPELVVLSACETGIGKLQRGEGAMSIARGFQYAGAQNILFSLWKINDQSTSRIMQTFYKEYDDHSSLYLANHQSKTAYLRDESISNIRKSPYYWSAFMYYGKLTTPEQSNTSFYLISLIMVCVIVFFLFWKLKERRTRDL